MTGEEKTEHEGEAEDKTHEPSQYEAAIQIADLLGESDEARRKYIVYLVKTLGRTQSRRLYRETLQLQENGGVMVPDGSRQRTASEIFFDLVQTHGKPKRRKVLRPFEQRPANTEESSGLPSRWEVAQKIAEKLGETGVVQQRQIEYIVWALGQVQAWAIMLDALEIDEGEGMLVPNGSRRRTVGGVFFHLVYSRGIPEEGKTLERAYGQGKKPVKTLPGVASMVEQPQPEVLPPLVWEDRIAVLREAEAQKGQANVKITVVGRPGKVVDRGQCIVTVMEAVKVPALPKGLPTPPAAPTKYTVYIGSKQWKKVSEAISDPEDVLIIEGFPTLDAQVGSIAVFATNTTTKKLQMASREMQKGKQTEMAEQH